MKKTALITLILVAVLGSSVVYAVEKTDAKDTKKEVKVIKKPRRERPSDEVLMPRSKVNYLNRMEERIQKQKDEHNAFIAELEEIKTTALKEKAKKTADLVDKLIEKKNTEFEKSIQKLVESMEKMREQMKKHMEKQTRRRARRKDGVREFKNINDTVEQQTKEKTEEK